MLKEVRTVIYELYIKKGKGFAKSKIESYYDFSSEVFEICQLNNVNVKITNSKFRPVQRFRVVFKPYINNGIEIEYESTLEICKLVNAYYLEHSFEINNPDLRKIGNLNGFSDQSYIKEQYYIEEAIVELLNNRGYKRLFYADMNEVIPEIEVPESRIFGNQMTVEIALFHDLYGFLDEE